MALPEKDDRELAGKSIGLTDEQIPEISRLKTGEAIVYQNGWEESVKAKIRYCEHAGLNPWSYNSDAEDDLLCKEAEMSLLFDILYDLYAFTEPSYCKEDLVEQIVNSSLSGRKKALLLDKVDSVEIPLVDDCAYMMAIVIGTDLCYQLQYVSDIVTMNNLLYRELQSRTGLKNNEHIDTFANMYMRGCSLEASQPFYEEWQEKTVKSKVL